MTTIEPEVSNPTSYLIGNAHLDPAWLWRWPEGFSEARATFASALERMREFPSFVFTASAAALYEWIERVDPDLFEEIRARVAEGRWCVVGGWRTQSDCNLPSGESFARNALYSQRYFRKAFGKICTTGYCVDSFGHAGSLPQLLAQGGMNAYVFMRPDPCESPQIPVGPFIWEGTDGTRILSFRLYAGYNTWLPGQIREQAEQIRRQAPPLGMILYGVGDHGGGPTRALLKEIEGLRRETPDIVYGDPDRFFAAIANDTERLPEWQGEMQMRCAGYFAAEGRIKRANRRTEWLLLASERAAVAAHFAVGAPVPAGFIEQAWKDVLFCQFHDLLAGSSERIVCDETLAQLGRASFTAGEIQAEALQRIGANVNTEGAGRALLVFNPHAFNVSGLVETEDVTFHPAFDELRRFQFLDADGKPAPFQITRPSTRTCSIRLVFPAELPSLGWRLYRVVFDAKTPNDPFEWEPPAPRSPVEPQHGLLQATPETLANEWLRLSVDEQGLIRIYDLEEDWEVFREPAGLPLVIDDPSDTWGHDVVSYDQAIGEFRLESRELMESGPLRGRLRLRFRYGESQLLLDYVVDRFTKVVRCDATLDWREKRQLLKLVYPVAIENPQWTTEIPYGEIGRPVDGRELPMQAWTDLADSRRGLAIANDSQYSLDARDGTLRITVLRSPVYAHGDPLAPRNDERFHDQGIQDFRLLLIPHGAAWRGEVARQAQLLNCPPVLSWEGTHPGRLPRISGPAVRVSADGVIVMALKRSEDGGAWVLRAFETGGKGGETAFEIPALGRTWISEFHAGEIKTFLIPDNATAAVRLTSFLEEAALK